MFDKEQPLLFETKADTAKSFSSFVTGIKGDPSIEYYAHIDLAVNRKKGDRLGFALGHVAGFRETHDEEKPIIKIDIAMVVTSPPGGEIQFNEIKQLVFFLQEKGFMIKKLTSDSWNSVDILQTFRRNGITAEVLSVDKVSTSNVVEPYAKFKDAIYEERVTCHPYELLAKELKQLELVNGIKVDHVNNSSKDCADAVCGVVYNIFKSNSSKILSFTPSFGGKRQF
jgi:hypothetical protein